MPSFFLRYTFVVLFLAACQLLDAQSSGLNVTEIGEPLQTTHVYPSFSGFSLPANHTLVVNSRPYGLYRTDGTAEGTVELSGFVGSPPVSIGGGAVSTWFVSEQQMTLVRVDETLDEVESISIPEVFPNGGNQFNQRFVATNDLVYFFSTQGRTDGVGGDYVKLLVYSHQEGETRTIFSDTLAFTEYPLYLKALGDEVVFSRFADPTDPTAGASSWAYSPLTDTIRRISEISNDRGVVELVRTEGYLYGQYNVPGDSVKVLLFEEGAEEMLATNLYGSEIELNALNDGRFVYATGIDGAYYGWNSETGEAESLGIVLDSNAYLLPIGKLRNDQLILQEFDGSFDYGKLYGTEGSASTTDLLLDLAELNLLGRATEAIVAIDNVFIPANWGRQLYAFYPTTGDFGQVDLPTIFSEMNFLVHHDHLLVYGFEDRGATGDPFYESAVAGIFKAKGGTLEVNIFRDDNADGIQQENEEGLPNYALNYTGAGTAGRLFSNQTGVGKLFTRAGVEYNIAPIAPQCFEITTDSSFTFTATSTDNVVFNVGLKPSENQDPSITGGIFPYSASRCGFENQVQLRVENNGCTDLENVEASLNLPEGVTLVGTPDPIPIINTGTSFGWLVDSLRIGEAKSFLLTLQMPGEDAVGQALSWAAELSATDPSTSTIVVDTLIFTDTLRCAIDPNDKQVFPRRPEPSNSNYTQFDETLTYTVRFQNTGNDTAFTVRIEDQLSTNLDWETFKPITASHVYTATLSEDGLATFLFENILLPDSTTNELLSHGFVTFEIKALPELEELTTVDNTVGIFFDFNEPVITNTVTSTLVEFLDEDMDGFFFWDECDDKNANAYPGAPEVLGNGVDEDCNGWDETVATRNPLPGLLEVFPNPVRNMLQLRYDQRTTLQGELFSMRGRRMQSFVLNRTHQLNLSNLPAGVYLLRLTDGRSGAVRVEKVNVLR